MNKLFIRLIVAFAAFSFGLVLTNLVKPAHTCDQRVTVLSAVPLSTLALTEDEAQIRAIYREYGPAQTRHDRKFFERIETEDFTLTVGDTTLSREEDIELMEEQPMDKTYVNMVDHLTMFEQHAVAHGYVEVRESNGVVENWPFSDVWVKRNGAWRIQSTISQ